MRSFPLIFSILAAALMSAGAMSAHMPLMARFTTRPTPPAQRDYTIGYELFRTIGCPGKRALDDTPCASPLGSGQRW